MGSLESTLIGSARLRIPMRRSASFVNQVERVADGAAEPVEGVHDDHIALAGVADHLA